MGVRPKLMLTAPSEIVIWSVVSSVRQMTADLAFDKGTFHNRQRMNYRFDAVAAVRVTETDDHQRTFKLTLVNGEAVDLRVTGSAFDHIQPGEDSTELSNAELDATGLANTLHVLEGIAAEGKEWIEHEGRRGFGRMAEFTSAISDLLD